ncbi:MAG: hypothetical protein OXQ29_00780 [Rhodospirillaceae bacterium]|nr:hypothetical protein [Rhodospirillaceae bacterium]
MREFVAALAIFASACISPGGDLRAMAESMSIPSSLRTLPAPEDQPSTPITTIHVGGTGGILAEAIGLEMVHYGFAVVSEAIHTDGVAPDEGIGVLDIEWTFALHDGNPNTVIAIVTAPGSGVMLAGVSWTNARAGAAGSPADVMVRKTTMTAAQEIAAGLVRQISPQD